LADRPSRSHAERTGRRDRRHLKLLRAPGQPPSSDKPRYAVDGIRAGATLTAAEQALKHGYLFRVGLNYWYIAPVRGASAVLKVRHGLVEEVWIAVKQLTGSHKADRELMTSCY
jgi:hypothetical protein